MTYDSTALATITGLKVEEISDSVAVKVRESATPARDGSYSAGGLAGPRRFTMRCVLSASTADSLRTTFRTVAALFRPGSARKFYKHSDEYVWAEPEGITEIKYGAMQRAWMRFQVGFFCADPYIYSNSETTQASLAAGGTINNGGSVSALPTFTLVIDDIGSDGTVTLENETTGESFTITPAGTGTYIINTRDETITKSSADMTTEVSIDSRFLTLAAGSNTLTVSTTGGLSVDTLDVAYRQRHLV